MINFLSGYKTYIMACVYGLDAAGASLGWWGADAVRSTVEQVMTVVFLRAGVTKSGPGA